MAGANRFTVVLVSALVLSTPALWSYLQGGLDGGEVGLRCAGALSLSIVVVAGLGALLHGYTAAPADADPADRGPVSSHRRRRGDAPDASAEAGAGEALEEVPAGAPPGGELEAAGGRSG